MATPSSITAKCNDGRFRTIYCHFDGHVSHNGVILFENYQDQQKIEELMALGDISSLDKSIECPEGHSFENPIKGYSVFYGRDRGEKVKPYSSFSLITCRFDNKQDYNYYWDGENWNICIEPLRLLSEVLIEQSLIPE
jgi:hypothetical protein